MFESIFGTPILVNNINLPEEKLEDMRVSMKKRVDLVGGNFNHYTGDDNDNINESQILSEPEFQCLIDPILSNARLYVDQITSHSHEYQQYIMKSWPVVIGHGGSIYQHTHEYAHLSAVFYLDDPEPNSDGEIRFVRPADQCLRKIGVNEFLLNKKNSQLFTKVQSRKNGLIIFNGAKKKVFKFYLVY